MGGVHPLHDLQRHRRRTCSDRHGRGSALAGALFPLDGAGWFRGFVVDDAVDAADLVADATRDPRLELCRVIIDVGGRAIGGSDYARVVQLLNGAVRGNMSISLAMMGAGPMSIVRLCAAFVLPRSAALFVMIGIAVMAAIAITLPQSSHAGEWKKQTHNDSIIKLRTGWDWTKPRRGSYWVQWNDGFTMQTHSSSWRLGVTPRIEVMVYRMAPQMYWLGRSEEAMRLDEDFLKVWNYLKKSGVSNTDPIQCEARECVTFTADGIYSCGAFTHWSGQLNDRNNTDLIAAYFCAARSMTVTAENLNKIFATIAIRGKTSGYEKRATMSNIPEQLREIADVGLSSRAEQGDAEAQFRLGHNYQNGIGGQQQNIFKARLWYTKAAENGHSEAQYIIGLNYEKGRFVSKDLDVALDWYSKSAEQGYAPARSALGRLQGESSAE